MGIHSQISTTNLPASRHSLESTQTIQPPSTAKMSLKNDKFPSSAAFNAINSALNAIDADRKDAIKQGNGIYAFTLKNSAGEESSWHIDLKETGKVGTGLGSKPNVTLSLSDADFGNLVTGKANAQRLFMSGKLKGDVMKATKMEPIFKKAQNNAKL